MSELANCPCGSDEHFHGKIGAAHYRGCPVCGLRASQALSAAEADEAWNSLAEDSRIGREAREVVGQDMQFVDDCKPYQAQISSGNCIIIALEPIPAPPTQADVLKEYREQAVSYRNAARAGNTTYDEATWQAKIDRIDAVLEPEA